MVTYNLTGVQENQFAGEIGTHKRDRLSVMVTHSLAKRAVDVLNSTT